MPAILDQRRIILPFGWDVNLLDWVVQPVLPGRVALTASAPTAATVGTSSAQALASNSSRKGLVLVNLAGGNISIGLGQSAVRDNGITLQPGATWRMGIEDFSTAAIHAIAEPASSPLSIQEFT